MKTTNHDFYEKYLFFRVQDEQVHYCEILRINSYENYDYKTKEKQNVFLGFANVKYLQNIFKESYA
ncbi:hypothetical protein D6745_01095 [Candidatus Woesearchaeota archaeon]|nr:MAG: hypothetical protein D6745_01095 [Candidatus Woesearchaeota archaeon]